MTIDAKKCSFEKELQSLIQKKINDFIKLTGSHPQDIKINLISFAKDDGHIDIVVDDVEINVGSAPNYEWRHDLH